VRAKAAHRQQRLRSRKPENGASVNLLLYPPVDPMALHSKFQLTAQGEEAPASCPPQKPASKKKSAKTEEPKGDF